MQNLKRNFILIGLIVLTVFIPFQDTIAADCKEILVYIFPGGPVSTFSFSDLDTYLGEDGFNVTAVDRSWNPELTPALLSNYGQIWIIDDGNGCSDITDTEINNLIAHYDAGNSILLTAEDRPITTNPVDYDDIHKIAQRFNTTMRAGVFDGTTLGESIVNQTGSVHSVSILSGVSTIFTSGETSNVTITTINPGVESVATSSSGFDIIYALDETTKRVVFHLSYFTFLSGVDTYINAGDSKQYAKNVANWLCIASDPPTCNLSVSPSSINSGDTVTLTWTSNNATAIDSSNFGAAGISGSATVSPTSSTTYNLTVSGFGETGSCATSVSVSSPSTPLPPISGGLIPCGRKTDNPDTDNVDERDECTVCHFFLMIKNIMDFITKIAVIVAILFISFGGLMYVLSTGNEAMLSKAKAMITYAIVGFILIFAAWIIIELILSTFGYTNPLGGEWDVIC